MDKEPPILDVRPPMATQIFFPEREIILESEREGELVEMPDYINTVDEFVRWIRSL